MLTPAGIVEKLHENVSEVLERARDGWMEAESDSEDESDGEEDSDAYFTDSGEEFEVEIPEDVPTTTNRRNRQRKEPLSAATADGIRRREEQNIPEVATTPFGVGRHFATSSLFMLAWDQHESDTFTAYQSRHADLVETFNKKRRDTRAKAAVKAAKEANEAAVAQAGMAVVLSPAAVGVEDPGCGSRGEKVQVDSAGLHGAPISTDLVTRRGKKPKPPLSDEELQEGDVPLELGHQRIVRRCIHGVHRKSRSKGLRRTKDSNFIECDARITVSAVRDQTTGVWSLVTRDEVNIHNHKCTRAVLESHGKSSLLKNPEAIAEVKRMIQARATAQNICDTLATNYNITVTPKQIANLRRDRLGGRSAMFNLKLLLERFSSFGKSRCLIIDDQQGQVCGVALQSASQRAIFESYGDNLILDWTHNTNNMGFYLGSLMVTSASGRGVSVFDFLCLEQTESMMTSVFEHFIKTNPSAVGQVKSIIIDKDYKEWRVLNRVFPKSVVLLCQFHALKWFVFVVTKKKYALTLAMRDSVLNILYSMVYCKTTASFDLLKSDLEELLKDSSPMFLEYMKARWYNCRHMWSDCERAQVFTALNTTSNRIESSWNQVKRVLGKKLRIDLCLEAVFSYQTAVLRREYKLINKYANRVILRSECDPFIRSAMADVCEYASQAVVEQWSAYVNQSAEKNMGYSAIETSTPTSAGRVFTVSRLVPESQVYAVDTADWKCSCAFSVTSALPCRHVMHVAQRVLLLKELPIQTIPARWSMKSAAKLRSLLRKNTRQIQSLRTSLLLSDAAFNELVEPDVFELDEKSKSVSRRVVYFRLKRKEESEVVVLNNLEKRRIVESELASITQFLMNQSTPQFMEMASELREDVAALKKTWIEKLRGGTRKQPKSKCQVKVKLQVKSNSKRRATGGQITPSYTNEDDGYNEACDMDEINKAIADGIADEERSYHDADEAQRLLVAKGARASTEVQGDSDDELADLAELIQSPTGVFMQTEGFAAIPYPEDEQDGWPVGTQPFTSEPTPSISESSMSAALNSVVRYDLSSQEYPTANSEMFLSSSSLSTVMKAVARHQLQSDPIATPATKRRAEESSTPDSVNIIKDLIARPKDDCGESRTSSRGRQRITLSTLPPRQTTGAIKKQRTSGGATGDRLCYVEERSDLPVSIHDCTLALATVVGVHRVPQLWSRVPCRLEDPHLKDMEATSSLMPVTWTQAKLNFRIKERLMKSLEAALMTMNLRGRNSNFFDLTESPTTRHVAFIHPKLRGFTSEDITDLRDFYAIRGKCESYRLDLNWLQKDVTPQEPSVPYLEDRIADDGGEVKQASQARDVSDIARASIISVLKVSSLQSQFSMGHHPQQLHSQIKLCEIIGYLPRESRLNDAVLMYALHQMAGDYPDVHVVSCIKADFRMASEPLLGFRLVVFPLHVGNCHWCTIFCRVTRGGVHQVEFYDPLHSASVPSSFLGRIQSEWTESCRPMLLNWLIRDCVAAPVSESGSFATMAPQHDGTSCGVYCLAAAWDRMSDEYYFHKLGKVGESAARQLRIRVMWRILCDSRIYDDQRYSVQHAKTIEMLTTFEDTSTAKKSKHAARLKKPKATRK